MNVINHRSWYNVQQFLVKSWIYHSQSRSSILDLMTACNEIKSWGLPRPQGINEPESSNSIEQKE